MSTPQEWISDKIENDPGVRAIRDKARDFALLKEQPGWQQLIKMLEREQEEWLLDLAKRLFDGEEVAPEEIKFMAGFYRGADYVLRHPEVAEDSFVKAARRAWVLYETARAESDEPGGSPHA